MAVVRVQFNGTSGNNKTPKTTLGSVPTQNNLLVCFIVSQQNSTGITGPTGYTAVDSGLFNTVAGYKMFYKIATGLESSTVQGSTTSSAAWDIAVIEYSGLVTTGEFDVTTNGSNSSTATSIALGPTSSAAQAQELALAAVGFDGAPGTVSYTGGFAEVDNETRLSIAELITTSATTFSSTISWPTARRPVAVVSSFKTNVVVVSQSISNTGAIATAQTFGTATLTPGTATVSPTGIASSEVFGTAAMGNVISPSGAASAQAFGLPVVGTPAVSILPAGITSAQAFGAGVVVTGPVTIAPTGIGSAEAFGNTGVIPLSPSFNAAATYEKPTWVYDEPNVSFGGGGVGFYLFRTPGRINIDLEGQFGWSLWTRVHRLVPITLIQHADGSWEEFAASPYILEPSQKYFSGGRGFNTDQTFEVILRKYIGGHEYIVNDALRLELNAAVTPQEPNGYSAYLTPTTRPYTGDEILLSGHITEFAS